MTLFENPLALEKTARQLEQAIRSYQLRLLRAEIDPSGPFIGKPLLTERSAFREIREAPLPDPFKWAWQRWAFRFSEARINAPLDAALSEGYRVERHLIDLGEPVYLTLRELLERLLTQKGQRDQFVKHLAAHTSRVLPLEFERWARRVELARRAGFVSLDEVTAPSAALEELAESLLKQTDDLCAQLVPPTLEGFLDVAHASSIHQGFPVKITPRTLRTLLGNDDWFHGLALRVSRLPGPISPASFRRALARVGAALVDAAAPSGQPFVVAKDPGGLLRRKMGALLAGLFENDAFGLHQLNLSRAHARAHARAFALSGMLHARTTALSVLLRAKACQSRSDCEHAYEALCHRTFGFALPKELAGLFPRLFLDAGQRLLGPCLASVWNEALIGEFDEDWFRNPRGLEIIRATLSQSPEVFVETESAKSAVDHYVRHLVRKVG